VQLPPIVLPLLTLLPKPSHPDPASTALSRASPSAPGSEPEDPEDEHHPPIRMKEWTNEGRRSWISPGDHGGGELQRVIAKQHLFCSRLNSCAATAEAGPFFTP